MTNPILQVQDLTIAFGQHPITAPVVSRLDFSLYKGECLGIVGESGSGKSLTSLGIMQLLPPTARVSQQSQILYQGQDLLMTSERKMRAIRGHHIAMIFQDASSALNPVFTIGYQLQEVLRLHQRLKNSAAKQQALAQLAEVGLPDPESAYTAYPHQLSGGMRQRAMIAMALCGNPKILIADEPTTALDVTIQAQVLQLLKTLQVKHDMSLIFISHDLAVVSQVADNILVMQRGVKVEQAEAKIFFKQPQHEYSRKLIAAIPPRHAQKITIQPTRPLLSVEALKVHFPIRAGILKRTVGYVKAVDGISFDLNAGQTLALVGESGSGKTTSGKAILRLLQNTSGKITYDGKDLTTLSAKAIRQLRQQMQIIFQDPSAALNPRMLVIDAICEGLLAQKKIRSREQAITRVDELLEQVELPKNAKWRYPHEFSGGEKQRICIARALALQPRLLVLDEPTSALDVSIQMQIMNLLEQLQQQFNLTYLLITHNLGVVAYMAHHIAVMYRGKIVEQGSAASVLENPQHTYTQQLIASIPKINNSDNITETRT